MRCIPIFVKLRLSWTGISGTVFSALLSLQNKTLPGNFRILIMWLYSFSFFKKFPWSFWGQTLSLILSIFPPDGISVTCFLTDRGEGGRKFLHVFRLKRLSWGRNSRSNNCLRGFSHRGLESSFSPWIFPSKRPPKKCLVNWAMTLWLFVEWLNVSRNCDTLTHLFLFIYSVNSFLTEFKKFLVMHIRKAEEKCATPIIPRKKRRKRRPIKRGVPTSGSATLSLPGKPLKKTGQDHFFTKFNISDAAKHRASDFFPPKMPKQSKPLIGWIETGKIKEE